ncbi:MAG: hypothetical protein P8M25_02885 [Paracoccaceae bacterium]|nr:hypothetical protein [Paracoccaceae bacterium]
MSHIATDLSLEDRASLLANAHYLNLKIYAEKTQALPYKHWAGLALAASASNLVDAIPFTFLGIPLLLLRDHQGRVQLFPNSFVTMV